MRCCWLGQLVCSWMRCEVTSATPPPFEATPGGSIQIEFQNGGLKPLFFVVVVRSGLKETWGHTDGGHYGTRNSHLYQWSEYG